MRRVLICFFLIFFVYHSGISQRLQTVVHPAFQPGNNMLKNDSTKAQPVNYYSNTPVGHRGISPSIEPVPVAFYSNHTGYFCKKELQLERVTRLPLRIRLGSVAYTDKLEGKPNTRQ
jgi:hypothetical protein